MSLDTTVGKELLKDICSDCKEKLEKVITKKDIKKCVLSPWGYKNLLVKIEDNTCEECKQKIWNRGLSKKS